MIAERSRGRVDSGHRAGSMLARRAPSGPGVRHCVPLPVSCDTLCNHITTQSNHRFDAPRAGGPHRASWRGPGAAARSSRLPPAPLVASASTSARRYRGLPASLRISGSRPRRAQVATAAEVTPNNEATCRRVIRSSPMRPPVTCRSRGSGTGRTRHKRRPAGRMPRHHVHRGPLAGRSERVRDGAGHSARLCPGKARAECRTARCRLHRKFCCNLQ